MSLGRFIPSRRWARRFIVGIVFFLISTIVGRWIWWEYTYAQGEKELAAAIAETDASDPRWRWEQIEEDRAKVPDEENSILVLKKFDESIPAKDPKQPWRKWDLTALKLPNGESLLPDTINNRLFDDERLAAIRSELREHEASVALAVAVKDCPRGRAPLQLKANVFNTLVPHILVCRNAGLVLALDSERLLHHGRAAEAWIRATAILNAGAGLRDEGMLISQLARIALRVIAVRRVERFLALGDHGADDLHSMQRRLTTEEKEELLVPALRGERALFATFFENLAQGKVTLSELADRGPGFKGWDDWLGWKLYRARLPADQAYLLRKMREIITIAELPSHERLGQIDQFTSRFRQEASQARDNKERIITALLLPAIDKLVEASIRDKALLRCTITALAVERYRLAKKEWPENLDNLCPKYLDHVLPDPFDGQPLKYRIRDDGVTIYSVGAGGVDDGGTNLTPSGREPGADVGFRLWNPDERGLPPAPKVKDELQR